MGIWVKKAPLPIGIADASSATFRGIIYVFGGYHAGPKNALSSVYAYDPTKDTWEERSNMPISTWGTSACVSAGKIHVFGGTDGDNDLKFHLIYDPIRDAWEIAGKMPEPRRGLTALKLKDGIHLIGGRRKNYASTSHWLYDELSGEFIKRSPMPTPKCWHSAAAINERIYVFGGSSENRIGRILKGIRIPKLTKRIYLSSNEVYDSQFDSWSNKAPCPVSVHGASRGNTVINDIIHYVGGFDGEKFYSSVYLYDPSKDIWLKEQPLTYKRDGAICEVVNNRLYVIGGRNKKYLPIGLPYNEMFIPRYHESGART